MTSIQTIKTIAQKEVKYLFREKTFYLLLGIFIIMAALSTYIGWATVHTIKNVYQVAVQELTITHQTVPEFPLKNIASLGIIKNMIIYVILIGSLLSIILGYFVGINDRVSGTVRLLFSRPIKRVNLLFGKILAIKYILALIILSAFLISLLSAGIFHVLSLTNIVKLLEFYFISFLYMFGFALLAMAFAIYVKNSASALLYALFVWMIITFALPELGSALFPTSSLNPVLPPTDMLQSSILINIHNIVYPFSISEHFKELSASILGIVSNPSTVSTYNVYSSAVNFLILIVWNILSFILAFRLFKKIKPAHNDLYE